MQIKKRSPFRTTYHQQGLYQYRKETHEQQRRIHRISHMPDSHHHDGNSQLQLLLLAMDHDFEVQRHCVTMYLQHMRYIHDDINYIKGRIEDIQNSLILTGVDFDKVGSCPSSSPDKIPEGLIRLNEMREELKNRLASYGLLLEKARDLCEPHYIARRALWLHYVEGMDWACVANSLGYSQPHIYAIRKAGICEIYELMPEEYRRYTIPNASPL